MDFDQTKILLKEKLGSPYFETDRCILFCGDSLTLQKKIDRPLFDAIITSPPYNIGKEYEEIVSLDKYIDWSTEWLADSCELLRERGCLLLNLGYTNVADMGRAIPLSYLLWDKVPLFLNQEIVWNYSAGVACRKYLSPRNEKILWYVKDKTHYTFNLDEIRDPNVKYPNSKRHGKSRVNQLGKNPSDVWQIAKVTTGKNRASKERTTHPCQFPLELVNRLLRGFTNKNEIVLDPFVGSGTTIEACITNDRYCVGFEIMPSYCEIIKNRIENLVLQKPVGNKEEE